MNPCISEREELRPYEVGQTKVGQPLLAVSENWIHNALYLRYDWAGMRQNGVSNRAIEFQ